MARNLKKDDDNIVTLYDPVDGSEVQFRHRAVTSRDRVRHLTRKYERQGNRLINRHHSACIESALEVLTGIREGDFVYGISPISSDPESEAYRPEWKSLVAEMAGDLLFILGADLFEPKADTSILSEIAVVSEFESESSSQPFAEQKIPPDEVELLPLPPSSGC